MVVNGRSIGTVSDVTAMLGAGRGWISHSSGGLRLGLLVCCRCLFLQLSIAIFAYPKLILNPLCPFDKVRNLLHELVVGLVYRPTTFRDCGPFFVFANERCYTGCLEVVDKSHFHLTLSVRCISLFKESIGSSNVRLYREGGVQLGLCLFAQVDGMVCGEERGGR